MPRLVDYVLLGTRLGELRPEREWVVIRQESMRVLTLNLHEVLVKRKLRQLVALFVERNDDLVVVDGPTQTVVLAVLKRRLKNGGVWLDDADYTVQLIRLAILHPEDPLALAVLRLHVLDHAVVALWRLGTCYLPELVKYSGVEAI